MLRVADTIRDEWTRAAVALNYPDYRNLRAWEEFRRASVHLAREYLATSIADELRDFFSPIGADYLVIENLPVDPELPPTPIDGMRPAGKQAVSEAVITGLVSPFAEMLAYVNEKRGSPIHEVAPVPGLEMTQSNAGRSALGFHSDNAFLGRRYRQQGILLFGLRNDDDIATLVLSADQIGAAASRRLRGELARLAFRQACPASFSEGGMYSAPGPILWRDSLGRMHVTAASSTIEPVDDRARRALNAFRELCSSLEPVRVVVRPGTALLFKDDRVLHGRDPVPGTRWLQRTYFRESLDHLRAVTRSSPHAFAFDARALNSMATYSAPDFRE
jgi:L-asparagine oxygenase